MGVVLIAKWVLRPYPRTHPSHRLHGWHLLLGTLADGSMGLCFLLEALMFWAKSVLLKLCLAKLLQPPAQGCWLLAKSKAGSTKKKRAKARQPGLAWFENPAQTALPGCVTRLAGFCSTHQLTQGQIRASGMRSPAVTEDHDHPFMGNVNWVDWWVWVAHLSYWNATLEPARKITRTQGMVGSN